MKKSFATMLVITLLTIAPMLSVIRALAQVFPPIPMTVEGYVFIRDVVTGENLTAPAGLKIYAKVGTEVIRPVEGSRDITDESGYYIIGISGPPEGTAIDLWVQEVNVTRITLAYYRAIELNLTVIDTVPPTAPTDLAQVSPVEDPTPSFTWTASTDNLRVEGYYVNISDAYATAWIGNVTAWECPVELPDGTYTINVWAKDLAGNNGTAASLRFTIQTIPKPAADFYAEPKSGTEPLTVSFYDNSTNFQTVTSWFWDFGDGTNSTVQNPVHTYLQDGAYTVTLTVTGTDLAGKPARTSVTKANYITVSDTGPTADFHATPTSGAKPLTVAFYDDSESYDGITSWRWNFGDGGTSTERNPVHIYTTAGVYTVTLTVTEADGDTDTKTRTNYITVTEVQVGALAVTVDVGSIHFKGEMAEFYFLTTYNGKLVNITDATLTLYKPPQGTVTQTLTYTQLATGVYLAVYQIPANAEPGTYTLVVNASYKTETVEAYGASLKSFLVSSTLTDWNAKLISINGTAAEIKTDTGIIRMNLTEINAKIMEIQGTVTTINSTVGQIKADLGAINATITGLITDAKGEVLVAINTALGNVTAKLDDLNATLVRLVSDAQNNVIAEINTAVGNLTAHIDNLNLVNLLNTLELKLDNMNATLVSVKDGVAEISLNIGDIKVKLNAINAKLVDISGTVATIDTNVGTIKTDVALIKPKIVSIEEDVATIESDVGSIKVDVSAIKPVVMDIKDGVATIRTTVGDISGKVITIDGNVAKVMTDVGVIKADASTIKTSVEGVPTLTIAIWIAVVLSLIAAIAAIYLVVTIHRKIAG